MYPTGIAMVFVGDHGAAGETLLRGVRWRVRSGELSLPGSCSDAPNGFLTSRGWRVSVKCCGPAANPGRQRGRSRRDSSPRSRLRACSQGYSGARFGSANPPTEAPPRLRRNALRSSRHPAAAPDGALPRAVPFECARGSCLGVCVRNLREVEHHAGIVAVDHRCDLRKTLLDCQQSGCLRIDIRRDSSLHLGEQCVHDPPAGGAPAVRALTARVSSSRMA